MQTKEIPLSNVHYEVRTCGYKNRKKFDKMLLKALKNGSLRQFVGCSVYKKEELDNANTTL
jgi:hypothetical protein